MAIPPEPRIYRALRGNYGLHNHPTTNIIDIIDKIMKEFEETGVFTNITAIVSKSVAEDPNVSIPCRAQELELSYGTLWRILHFTHI